LLSIFIQKKILCHVHKTLRFHFSFGMIWSSPAYTRKHKRDRQAEQTVCKAWLK
jgi:hypothetical protein